MQRKLMLDALLTVLLSSTMGISWAQHEGHGHVPVHDQATTTAAPAADHMAMHSGHMMSSASVQYDPSAPTAAAVKVENCWIRLQVTDAPSAGYMDIKNEGSKDLSIVGAFVSSFGGAMLHESVEKNGIVSMAMLNKLDLPAGNSVSFIPGKHHLMLNEKAVDVKVGDVLKAQILLSDNTRANTECVVKPINASSYK